MSSKLRFGIIGTGGMGKGHIKNLKESEHGQLTAVADINKAAVEAIKAEHHVEGFYDVASLVNSGKVDAVLIATPHFFHEDAAVTALKAGLHVLCEKPIAVTVSQADRMIAASKEANRKLAIMFQHRARAEARKVKEIITSGELGEITRVHLIATNWYRTQAYYNSGSWRATWKGEGGGVLLNQAPHPLDLMAWFCGLPKTLMANVSTRLHNIEVEDDVTALLEYENGASGIICITSAEYPGVDRLEVYGDRGMLTMQGSKVTLVQANQSIRKFTHETLEVWGKPEKVTQTFDFTEQRSNSYVKIIDNFSKAVMSDEKLISPGEEGLLSLELINGMILSGKRNQKVTLPVNRAEYDALLKELISNSKAGR